MNIKYTEKDLDGMLSEALEEEAAKNPAAVALGKIGGKAKTKAKQDASRENGKLGGRPKALKVTKKR